MRMKLECDRGSSIWKPARDCFHRFAGNAESTQKWLTRAVA
jgi:hypothetical protein